MSDGLTRTRQKLSRVAEMAKAVKRLRDTGAQQNIAVDAGFDIAGFVDHAGALTDSSLTLYTLPISEFGQDTQGEDVNIVDVQDIRAIVHNLFTKGSPPEILSLTQSPSVPTTLDVVNATNHDGLGSAVERSFGAEGLTAGTVTTADSLAETSTIAYGLGAGDAAHILADRLQLTATASDAVAPDTVRLTIGADFAAAQYMSGSSQAATATPVTSTPRRAAPRRPHRPISPRWPGRTPHA